MNLHVDDVRCLKVMGEDATRASREYERHRVALTVRYGKARDFVVDYAENLSSGGLFVRTDQPFERGELIDIVLDLPGFGEFEIKASAAHSIAPDAAADLGRSPGTGFSIVDGPTGFFDALHIYLVRLGKRRECTVLVAGEELRAAVGDAGYLVAPLPPPNKLFKVIALNEEPVIAAVVPGGYMNEYMTAATAMGTPEIIKVIDHYGTFGDLLMAIDEELIVAI